ncbi:MAG: Serine/threonine-protein phosphatase 2A activator 1 [Caeruleum heppii]|nr:MAG: Serine/threonine-protein phosphatase 2A activator 1 [Caeruleum heppii]
MTDQGSRTTDASKSSTSRPELDILDPTVPHAFASPAKRINEGHDVPAFLTSKAYDRIMTFLFQVNEAMYPHLLDDEEQQGPKSATVEQWELNGLNVKFSDAVVKLGGLMHKLEAMIDEAPPESGPRRFGNVSFRKWYQLVESRLPRLLRDHIDPFVLAFKTQEENTTTAEEELSAYLLGSFGSPQRLDYGTGHELSFLAFLGGTWMLGGFSRRADGEEERSIVLGIFEPYLHLIRRLIQVYNLEPAGSHGVWGLDDHSFLPYIFGSAQYCPAVSSTEPLPQTGSLPDAPDPADVAKANVVAEYRDRNMYFGAVGFIYDVKKGPFWEHSPILFDISGVRAGWAKINKGMIKMYNAEVLSKFPVVQHFPFGSLFSWDQDPNAARPPPSSNSTHQPSTRSDPELGQPGSTVSAPLTQEETKAPWAKPPAAASAASVPMSAAPWAKMAGDATAATLPTTAAPWARPDVGRGAGGGIPSTAAPWPSQAGKAPPSMFPRAADARRSKDER